MDATSSLSPPFGIPPSALTAGVFSGGQFTSLAAPPNLDGADADRCPQHRTGCPAPADPAEPMRRPRPLFIA
jgi:hypothetical protein